ncbi:MAG TPA: ABC transporter [Porticoccaceae bacterium]|nr:ABC transporter [Porticoccaceae bacterium]
MNKPPEIKLADIENPLLEARGIGKTVAGPDGELTLLEAVDFTLAAGESVAITGPSGSGKSTLLGLLAGLDTPTSGEVLLENTAFSQLDEDARALRRGQLCAFVFQHFHLVNDLNALENVMLPLELKGEKDAKGCAQQWLERVGLEHRLKHFPSTLSGGEQQRVALARAFAVQPRLLFADEPTGSLDHANGRRIGELLFELNRETGTALVLVTHDDHLARRCQRQLQLEAGRLSETTVTANVQ